MDNTSGSSYKVRVENVADESDYDCSDAFYLMASDMAPTGTDDGPMLMVTSPAMDDVAMAGDEYTVEFDYDNGLGSSVGRFAIDLYFSGGTGDCGTFFSTICDKPTIGCRDSSEYLVFFFCRRWVGRNKAGLIFAFLSVIFQQRVPSLYEYVI